MIPNALLAWSWMIAGVSSQGVVLLQNCWAARLLANCCVSDGGTTRGTLLDAGFGAFDLDTQPRKSVQAPRGEPGSMKLHCGYLPRTLYLPVLTSYVARLANNSSSSLIDEHGPPPTAAPLPVAERALENERSVTHTVLVLVGVQHGTDLLLRHVRHAAAFQSP